MRLRSVQTDRVVRGFSLLEVLVAIAILLAGMATLVASFPVLVQSGRDTEMLTRAAALAQLKAEEIRRDDSHDKRLVTAIQQLDEPTEPIVFPQDSRLTYSFSGVSLLYREEGDPRGNPGVARVIVRYAPDYRPGQEVVYELRFN